MMKYSAISLSAILILDLLIYAAAARSQIQKRGKKTMATSGFV